MEKSVNIRVLRIIAVMLAFATIVSFIPTIPVMGIVEGDEGSNKLAFVKAFTEGLTISGNESESVVVSCGDAVELSWYAAEDIRPKDGWWIGVDVIAPEGFNEEKASLQHKGADEWEDASPFDEVKDTENSVQVWSFIDETALAEAVAAGEKVTNTWRFDWDGDEIYEQTLTFEVDPALVTLVKDGETVYPAEEAEELFASAEAFTEGLVIEGNEAAEIVVSVKDSVELNWYAAEDIRPYDGWWIGINVTAPEGFVAEDVSFRSKNGDSWGEPNSFVDSRDTENTIEVWCYVNEAVLTEAVLAGENVVRSWSFDWNGVGEYEQVITFEIDPDKVVLKDENGNTAYPYFGEVIPLRGGSVSENGEVVEVIIEETTLELDEIDRSIGRDRLGWWVGVQVNVPSEYSAEVLKSALLSKRDSDPAAKSGWGSAKEYEFWKVKDSADDAGNHYVCIWMLLTPEILKSHSEAGVNVSSECTFDWEGNGSVDQTVKISVVPGDKIVLNKGTQKGFGFTKDGEQTWVGDTYTNDANGGSTEGAVKYSIAEGSDIASIDEETGVVTFNKIGEVTVKAVKAGDDYYDEIAATYTVKAVKRDITDFRFSNEEKEIIIPFERNEGNVYKNAACGYPVSLTVKYSVENADASVSESIAEIDEYGTVTYKSAGTVIVTATIEDSVNYSEKTISYTLVIEKSNQKDVTLAAPESIVYSPNGQTVFTVGGGSGTGKFVYSVISGEEYATVNAESGVVTTLKGNGSFTVSVKKLGDGGYLDSKPVKITVNVLRAKQTGFGFGNDTVIDLTYNVEDNTICKVPTGGENTDGKITYAIKDPATGVVAPVSGDGVAEGTFEILKAGSAVIVATREGNDCYESVSAEYTINVAKADPDITVKNINLYYGEDEYQIVPEINYAGTGEFSYSCEENSFGASVDENGLITFDDARNRTGSVNITITKAEDDCYNKWSKTIVLTVDYPSIDDPIKNLIEITGNKINEKWYTGDITLEVPEGYGISFSGNRKDNEWKESIVFDTENTTGKTEVFIKNGQKISKAIELKTLFLDKTNPENVNIEYSTSIVEKILEGITFGFYDEKVEVTFTATDSISGVAYFEWTYTVESGASNINKETFTDSVIATTDKNGVAKATVMIPAEARGTVSVKAYDNSGRNTEKADGRVIVVDHADPVLTPTYIFTDNVSNEKNGIYYTQDKTTVQFKINEANFDLSLKAAKDEEKAPAPVVTVTVAGATTEVELDWTRVDGTDNWIASFDLEEEGDYTVKASYADRSEHSIVEYTQEIRIDKTEPEIGVVYGDNDPVEGYEPELYDHNRVATVTVTEHNFDASKVELKVTAQNILGENVEGYTYVTDENGAYIKEFYDAAKKPENWTNDGDVWTLNVEKTQFNIDANYTVSVDCTDLSGRVAKNVWQSFMIDKTPAELVSVEYSSSVAEKILEGITFGFYQAPLTVTVTAKDMTSGVKTFDISYIVKAGLNNSLSEGYEWTDLEAQPVDNAPELFVTQITIPKDNAKESIRGSVTVVMKDYAGNSETKAQDKIIVKDNIAPEIKVEYIFDEGINNREENDILYVGGKTNVLFTVTETNFDLSLMKDEDGNAAAPVVKVNGEEKPLSWKQTSGTDEWTSDLDLDKDGDYVITVTYTDRATNEMATYTKEIHIDTTDPLISVDYDNKAVNNELYYKADRTATVTFNEHNFIREEVEVFVTAVDINGDRIDGYEYTDDGYVKSFSDAAKNGEKWSVNAENGDEHYLVLPTFTKDAIYTLKIRYTDIAGNVKETAVESFVVDHKESTELEIIYSDSIIDKIIDGITFGFYNPEITVTLTAKDITSGVDYFEWTYTKQDGTSETLMATSKDNKIDYDVNEETASVKFTIDKDARGSISFKVTDNAGNSTSTSDDDIISVVDTTSPEVTVTYTAADGANVQFVDEDDLTVETFENAHNMLVGGNVTATIEITDANFFDGVVARDGVISYVTILLEKTDDDGNVSYIEYVPEGAEGKHSDAEKAVISWTSNGDIHTAEIVYEDNADYVLSVEYTDLSGNEANINANDGLAGKAAYTSKIITVDKIAPVVTVEYGNKNVIHTIDGRDYYDDVQTATITVVEHNFRADDFAAVVEANDVTGADVKVEDFAKTLSDRSSWIKSGNTYTAKIEYPVDANYTFDYSYADLARNVAAEYETDAFTVDKTAPENLTVTYSTSVLERILSGITFGYYNAQMTVTITADDDTAGVHYFVYSFIKGADVSEVNAELLDAVIKEANENIVRDGKTFTAEFTIPELALGRNNQFNGTVEFTAYDRSENSTEKTDDRRIVVDNISPVATITYNAPVQNANNVSYYNGNINATVTINEANFYSEDVTVSVTKDGAAYPVNVLWSDNSADVHVGTFTLTADGDYIISVAYTDRSSNKMTDYVSNRFTLDTKAPVVNVTNIKNDTANKDEKYGFTITVEDTNMDASTFKPVLYATVKNEDGSYEKKTVSLGDMITVEAGKKYSYTVENLDADAVYVLSCALTDMSKNAYSKVILEDGNEYEEVRFSINRNGSTFVADEYTDEIVDRYYIYNVEQSVVIEEINVDPIEKYTVKLNGKELKEGTDYTTTLSANEGEWSKRTYSISKDLFDEEGEYSVVIESVDKADSSAYSDVKDLTVAFVVDRTAPVLTISGLENGGRYQVEEQTVTVIPTDDGGKLYSLKITVLDSDGNPYKDENGKDVSVRFEMSGEEFLEYLRENDGKVIFTVPTGYENQVRIECSDYAEKTAGVSNTYDETFTKVTVSQSGIVIFYADKPLFYGTIAGAAALIAAIIFFIIFLKKKKEKKEENK